MNGINFTALNWIGEFAEWNKANEAINGAVNVDGMEGPPAQGVAERRNLEMNVMNEKIDERSDGGSTQLTKNKLK